MHSPGERTIRLLGERGKTKDGNRQFHRIGPVSVKSLKGGSQRPPFLLGLGLTGTPVARCVTIAINGLQKMEATLSGVASIFGPDPYFSGE